MAWIVGKVAQDVGVKVLLCHSHLFWLVFEGSIPTHFCFSSENFSCFSAVVVFFVVVVVVVVGF